MKNATLPLLAFLIYFDPSVANGTCTQPAEDFRISLAQAPAERHYNWFREDADRSHGAAQLLIEPLFAVDPLTGDVVGWLARSYRWIEEKSLEINLDPQATWSDGVPFSAEDVRFSIQLAIEEASLDGLHVGAIRDAVAGVTAPANHRVVISLNKPDPDFIERYLTANKSDAFTIVPKHVWESEDPLGFENIPPIGTGPYAYVEDGADWPDWVRRDNWWGVNGPQPDLPAPARIEWHAVSRAEDAAKGLTRGCTDIVDGVSIGLADGILAVAEFVSVLGDRARAIDLYGNARWMGWSALPEVSMEGVMAAQARWFIHALKQAPFHSQIENR